ncbi:MAG: nucleotide exchange factor GrpE [Gammaproteobacteria bacterium]|nr:nucleotide exchange factor GrpE [Gammaproteobacteria bacterium]MDH5303010.1 nucleotide exchange factor GrpE [Gammaproteobacteria bacterium]MDH5321243.1 nucleotide exchange factor GrpE [Gammaproteobacteria bacterium]
MNAQPDQPLEETEQSEDVAVGGDTGDAGEAIQAADPAANLAAVQAKADENWDLYLRAVAEAENVRKRAARDVEHARKYALEAFSKEMLAVRDSFEMAIDAADAANPASLVEGNQASLKLLTTALERFGISEVNPLGEPFNPEFHEAISMQPSADAEPGSVLIVVQKGYTLNGRLLRPAMVVVAAAE